MKKKIVPMLIAIMIAIFAIITLIIGNKIEKNKPSKKVASEDDIYKLFKLYDGYKEDEKGINFDGATRAADNQIAIVVQNELVNDRAFIEDGKIYLNINFINQKISKRFYWDNNENILIFTTPTDIIKAEVGGTDYYVNKVKNSVDYKIVKTEGQAVYVAIDFVKQYANMDYKYFEKPNRIVITSEYDIERYRATLKTGKKIRISNSIKADILISQNQDIQVTVLEDKDKWSKVCTDDGYIGYIKTSDLGNVKTEMLVSEKQEPEYTSISKDSKISMAWHMVTNNTSNNQLVDLVTNAKGLNVVAPTWFRLSSNNGDMTSLASSNYVSKAHLVGLDVWAVVDDQSGESDNREIFTYTSKREKIINQLISTAIEYNLDGINVDFEYITDDIAKDYLQFLRELSVKCRINGIVLSVDNKVPIASNLYYDRSEQGIIADYVIIMGYDEHWGKSSGSGSVASLPFVAQGIADTLKEVPASKIINAIPFYTRIWQEDASGNYVNSQAVGMDDAMNSLTKNGAQINYVESFGQNYGEYSDGTSTYRIWLEDATSIEKKLQLMNDYQLAGVAAWRLGYDNADIWNTIVKYTN